MIAELERENGDRWHGQAKIRRELRIAEY